MSTDLRTILRDVRAAARIGHIESVWAALDSLLDFPEIAGNHHLSDTFLKKVILPVGEALAQPLLNLTTLRPLISHSNAGIRAIAGAALAAAYMNGLNGNGLKELSILAQDPRKDVREAVLLACTEPTKPNSDKQIELYKTWQSQPSPRLQELALQLLPYLPEKEILEQLQNLESYEPPQEPGVRRALVASVSKLGQGEYGLEVLKVLSSWAVKPDRYYWVITRCLSKSWAAHYPKESLALLSQLAAVKGPHKRISSTLAALQRHGARAEVDATLQDWLASQVPELQAAGKKAQEKLISNHDEETTTT